MHAENMLKQTVKSLRGIGVDRRDILHDAVIREQGNPMLLCNLRNRIGYDAVIDCLAHNDDHINDVKRNQVIHAVTACVAFPAGVLFQAGIEHQNRIAAAVRLVNKSLYAGAHFRVMDAGCTQCKNKSVLKHMNLTPFNRIQSSTIFKIILP